eukprot:2123570-Rhodomonas_salina.1
MRTTVLQISNGYALHSPPWYSRLVLDAGAARVSGDLAASMMWIPPGSSVRAVSTSSVPAMA